MYPEWQVSKNDNTDEYVQKIKCIKLYVNENFWWNVIEQMIWDISYLQDLLELFFDVIISLERRYILLLW